MTFLLRGLFRILAGTVWVVLSLVLLPIDLLRLTFLWLRLTLRFAGQRYTWFLAGFPSDHAPRMEVYLCRPHSSSSSWDDKTVFRVRRPGTLWLFARITGIRVPRLSHLGRGKSPSNMVWVDKRAYLRMVVWLMLGWMVVVSGSLATWKTGAPHRDEAALAAEYRRDAEHLLDEGKPRQARIQYLNSLQQEADHPDTLWGLARCARILNQTGEEQKTLEHLLKRQAGHSAARLALIDVLRRQGRSREALAQAEEGVQRKPDEMLFRVRLGECQRQLGRAASALENAQTVLKRMANHDRALLLAAAAAADLGNRDLAQAYLEKIVSNVPQERQDPLAMARIQMQCGFMDEARKQLEPLLAKDATRAPAARELAELKLASGDPDGAIALYQSLMPQQKGDASVRVRLAELLLVRGRLDEAYETGNDLIRVAPESAAGPLVLATVYYLRGLWSACVEQCKNGLEVDPGSIAGRTLLSRALMHQAGYREAISWLNGLLDAQNPHLEILLLLAECHLELKQNREAQQWLERAMARFPEAEAPHLLAARLAMARGRHDQAVASYRKILTMNPQQSLALNNLAALMVARKKYTDSDLDEALGMASSAWELQPGNPDIADTLGWIHVLRGAHGQAHPLLRYAVRERPNDVQMRLHWVVALAGLGQKEEALAQLTLVRQQAPDMGRNRMFRTFWSALTQPRGNGGNP